MELADRFFLLDTSAEPLREDILFPFAFDDVYGRKVGQGCMPPLLHIWRHRRAFVIGTVVRWKKKVGDPVAKGEAILEVSSEKIESEVESPEEGVLLAITVEEGGVVPYGTVLGLVGQSGEQIGAASAAAREEAAAVGEYVSAKQAARESAMPVHPDQNAPVQEGRGGRKVSPVARKLAEEAGLDLEAVVGTGPQGRITKEDVEQALAASASQSQTKPSLESVPGAQEHTPDTLPASGIKRIPVPE